MTAGDGKLAVIAVRPRPGSKRRHRFRPALGRTGLLTSLVAGTEVDVQMLTQN